MIAELTKFALTVPQATLSADGTSVLVPDVLVAQNAYARALVERGEDGGFLPVIPAFDHVWLHRIHDMLGTVIEGDFGGEGVSE